MKHNKQFGPQEYADRGSLSEAIAAGRFRLKLDGRLDMKAVLKCLIDIASGVCARVQTAQWIEQSFWSACMCHKAVLSCGVFGKDQSSCGLGT